MNRIRLAVPSDAEDLFRLNAAFNDEVHSTKSAPK